MSNVAQVAKTRQQLKAIVTMTGRLLTEAVHRGINSEAAMLDGPAADPEAYGYQIQTKHSPRICTCDPGHTYTNLDECPLVNDAIKAILEDQRNEPHPKFVLGTWHRIIADHLGHDISITPTVESAAAYIGQQLTHLAEDDTFDFEELASEIKGCHAHLESVLSEGVRAERGAPCPSCGGPPLEKEWGVTEAFDMWWCPSSGCHQVWTEVEYRTMIDGIYLEVADRLTAKQIEAKYRVKAGTIRQWASRESWPVVRDTNGVRIYDVGTVLAMRDRVSA